jgi:hypothetical protein
MAKGKAPSSKLTISKAQGNKPTNSKTQSDKPENPKAGLPRSEWLAIIGVVIAGCFTLIAAIVTALGPSLIEKAFPQETPIASSATPTFASISPTQTTEPMNTAVIQSPLPQPTLSLPQFAPSLTSSCEQAPSEPVAVVDQLSASRSAPLRFDFVVVHPAHNLLPEGFTPASHTFSDEASIKQLPIVDRLEFYVDIVGLNEKEWIRIENFILVRFDTITMLQAPDVNVATSVYGGGSRTFHTSACWQGKVDPNTPFASSRVTSADIFTVSPGEFIPIWLTLDLSGLDPAIYNFHLGVVYTYEGTTLIAWSDREFSIMVPDQSRRKDWIYYPIGNGISFMPDN